VVRRAHAETDGDLLVFLPGAGEVGAVAARLHGLDVVPLHGRLPPAAQDEALRRREGRRVVLATSVAESSLTVPGVRTVVDAGLTRVPRTDLARGLGSLVTVPVSRASAHQRAGRDGRHHHRHRVRGIANRDRHQFFLGAERPECRHRCQRPVRFLQIAPG